MCLYVYKNDLVLGEDGSLKLVELVIKFFLPSELDKYNILGFSADQREGFHLARKVI